VLREYLTDSRGWSVGTDYVYRDGLLLAAETQAGRRHFHLDHLGTPRLITRASGDRVAYHFYYPFGEEATAFNQDSERMKFTGHERDLGSAGGAGDDLDYMHARHESPVTGRFLSVDKADGRSSVPQSWNRYSYALGNPVRFIDPNGLEPMEPTIQQFLEAFFGTSLSHIEVEMGLKGELMTRLFARGFPALTVGSTVYLSVNADAEYASGSSNGVGLMAHEVTHAFDYNALGKMLFIGSYLLEANNNFVQGSRDQKSGQVTRSFEDAYENISFEVRANDVERLVRGFLEKNPDIQAKIANGQTLTAEDIKRVQGYAIGLLSQGRLRLGLQFINGQLSFVRLSVK
jgi:RHS repeat-associated protein